MQPVIMDADGMRRTLVRLSHEIEERNEGFENVVLVGVKREETLFTRLFDENNVDKAVFGHLHGAGFYPLRCERGRTEYFLTSCDKVNFRLTQIL